MGVCVCGRGGGSRSNIIILHRLQTYFFGILIVLCNFTLVCLLKNEGESLILEIVV